MTRRQKRWEKEDRFLPKVVEPVLLLVCIWVVPPLMPDGGVSWEQLSRSLLLSMCFYGYAGCWLYKGTSGLFGSPGMQSSLLTA